MQITVTSPQAALPAEDVSLITRRLLLALSRFAPRITRVTAMITDESGPRSGLDTTCRVIVRLKAGGLIVAEDWAAEVLVAVSGAAERAARSLSRQFARGFERAPAYPGQPGDANSEMSVAG